MRITDLYFSTWLRPGTVHSLSMDSLSRSYVVHVPKGHDQRTPMPVVLALHGATINGPMMAWFSGLNRKADEAGFIAVYPNGTGKHSSFTWNGGNCCGSAMQNNVDDVAFINALLDDVMRTYRVDLRRIYDTGMSNGAIMAYRLASELSDRITAVAPVAGTVEPKHADRNVRCRSCTFTAPPMPLFPSWAAKAKKSISGTNFHSVDHSIREWVKLNGCNESPKIDLLSDRGDELAVSRKTYGEGKDGTEVVLVVIEGGEHKLPGIRSPARILGKSALNISANGLMWEFFEKHPMRGAP